MKVLLTYDYFTPAYKAGGPIQSCANLVSLFNGAKDIRFDVLTSAKDLDGTTLTVQPNVWATFNKNTDVYYAALPLIQYIQAMRQALQTRGVDVVYIQGMFSVLSVVIPLLLGLWSRKRIVIAPRGMLQQGALSIKPLKKKLFLALLYPFLKSKQVSWHATDQTEQQDIAKLYGSSRVTVISNVPRMTKEYTLASKKQEGILRVVTISLISRKKNHIHFLEKMSTLNPDLMINYDIYGPVKDIDYLKVLEQKIGALPSNVQVKIYDAILPAEVASKLNAYDLFVLPTLGENFGHAIFEALASGVPVLLSDTTPWVNLEAAGEVLSLADSNWKKVIEAFAKEDSVQWRKRKKSARLYAENFVAGCDFVKDYTNMFKGIR